MIFTIKNIANDFSIEEDLYYKNALQVISL